jgi:hypothetical protein
MGRGMHRSIYRLAFLANRLMDKIRCTLPHHLQFVVAHKQRKRLWAYLAEGPHAVGGRGSGGDGQGLGGSNDMDGGNCRGGARGRGEARGSGDGSARARGRGGGGGRGTAAGGGLERGHSGSAR